jgi:hypothetical protein
MAQPFGPVETPPVEPPAHRSHRRLIAIIAAAATMLVIAAIVIVAVIVAGARETTYRIVTPAQAAGLKIGNTGASPVDTTTPQYRNLQKLLVNRAQTAVNVVYEDTSGSLYSVRLASGDLGDPVDLLARLRANPPVAGQSSLGSIVTITTRWSSLAETAAGPHGGTAACGDVAISTSLSTLPTTSLTQCAWQTEHTYGEVSVPLNKTGRPVTTGSLADIMRRLRTDLEQPA